MRGRRAGSDRRSTALCLWAVVLSVGGLSSCAGSSSTAPAVVMCGHTLVKRGVGSGDSVNDATRRATVRIDGTSRSGIVLLLTNDCSHGATLQISPDGSLSVAAKVSARDGKLAGVVLTPHTRDGDVLVTHADGKVTRVEVRLSY
jgi:hypothetical protein